ncbi:MAG: glycosyltransferase family 4 protein [Solirubrobacterales bacterium]
MRIGIDVTSLRRHHVGTDNYLKHLLAQLARADTEGRYFLFANLEDRALLRDTQPSNFSVLPVATRARATRLAFQQAGLPVLASAMRLDVIHSPSQVMPMVRGRARHLLTVHDLTQLSLPECHTRLRRSWAFRRAIHASVRRADLIVVPSAQVGSDVQGAFGVPAERVCTIPEGVSSEFSPAAATGSGPGIPSLGIDGPYALFVGSLEPRKGLETLLEAYLSLIASGDTEEQLVIAGKRGWGYRGLLARARRPDLRGRVRFAGYVDQAILPALYANARAFVYPSRAEGFGLPPLEAMASGVPTVATRTSALAENLDGAAELVPVGDAAHLAGALRRVLRDEALRARLRERGLVRAARFRWETTARTTLDRYRALAELGPRGRRQPTSTRRPSVAER